MDDFYVDIHSHPTFMPFNREECATVNEYWPSSIPDAEIDEAARSKNPLPFLQSDFVTIGRSKLRVVFASLLPLEQGFVWYRWHLLANSLQYMLGFRFDKTRVQGVQSESHDYFADLKREYSFLTNPDNLPCPASILQSHVDIPEDFKVRILSGYEDLKELVDSGDIGKTVAVVVTVEGGHALGCGSVDLTESIKDEDLNQLDGGEAIEFPLDDVGYVELGNPDSVVNRFTSEPVRTLLLRILTNIKEMKGWGDGDHAPFLVTFSHHFWNQLCGHAISLPMIDFIEKLTGINVPAPLEVTLPLLNQTRGIEVPMTEFGKVVLCALLSKNNGKRTIIDVKHLSLAGKRWYFDKVNKYNDEHSDQIIPVVSSHSAVSGEDRMPSEPTTLDPYVAHLNYEASENLNPWDINLSREEIEIIHKTDGLFGVNLDKRITSGKERVKRIQSATDWSFAWAVPVADQICQVASAIAHYLALDSSPEWPQQVEKNVWRRTAMGSDFDGAIAPLNAYARVTDFAVLEVQLFECLKSARGGDITLDDKVVLRECALLEKLTDDNLRQIVEWFMRGNAVEFLKTYFNDEYRAGS